MPNAVAGGVWLREGERVDLAEANVFTAANDHVLAIIFSSSLLL
jgi:hypothetical protein